MDDYVCPVKELEQRLKEAAQHLALPPSSTNDLLDLLDKTEQLLTFVGQAPSIKMQGALVHSMEALIAEGLVNHSEIDVRVSVASCLCEVARITAPEPPYNDEIMKEIFQLNVLAFKQLSIMSGLSYHKAIHILESVAQVKSCLLMLDMEFDALVLEMFVQFLSEIRENHPHTVFSDMEAVMTIVIEESDEIATELLSLLISHVTKQNQIAAPASWKVAEKVLRNCNNTLKPYSETITKLTNSNLDDYAEVVTVLCQNAHENDHMGTRSTRSSRAHKRDLNTLENGGSHKSQLKGKELETPRRGRPKKHENSLYQDNGPDSVQKSRGDTRRTRFQDKRQPSKTNGNIENSSSLYNVVIKKEAETISDDSGAEPLMQHISNNKTQKRRKPSSSKRVANGSRGKEIPKKWGQDLVGHRVKVWWPLDKMYYQGAVSSYNSLDDKYKVLYADGDEELLDLHHEKWMLLDEISPDQQQEQVADLTSPMTTPAKWRKQKAKRKLESSLEQKDNSSAQKRPLPAESSRADNEKNTPVPTPDISCGLKLTKKATNDMEENGDSNPNEELQEKKASESSEIKQRLDDMEKNGDSNPNGELQEKKSSESSEITQTLDDMEKNGDSNSNGEMQEKKASEQSEIIQTLDDLVKNGDSNPNGELQEKEVSETSEITQRLDDMEKNGDSNLNEELQEKELSE